MRGKGTISLEEKESNRRSLWPIIFLLQWSRSCLNTMEELSPILETRLVDSFSQGSDSSVTCPRVVTQEDYSRHKEDRPLQKPVQRVGLLLSPDSKKTLVKQDSDDQLNWAVLSNKNNFRFMQREIKRFKMQEDRALHAV